MKIGILITSISNFGRKGFYNAQEIGLAKAISKLVDSVIVYKLVSLECKTENTGVEGYDNIKVNFIPTKNRRINGFLDTSILEKKMTALIHFSDTQFSVPKAFAWCNANKVRYIPYIGVIESHSTHRIKKVLSNVMFMRNLAVYKKCFCCAKTPIVKDKLSEIGVRDVEIAPVGLDIDLLNENYGELLRNNAKRKYGYAENDRVILFIGRLIEEKQPLKMIELFAKIREINKDFKLLMVGEGALQEKIEEKITELDISDVVQRIDSLPNQHIWEIYRLADVFVNLNKQEIFGMAILEAMFYECRVVAWKAPGPNFIIQNGISGDLVENDDDVIDKILHSNINGYSAHERIINNFVWDNMANVVYRRLYNEQ